MQNITSIKSLILGAGAALFLLTGCVGYRLGSMLPDDIQTVYIPNIINETREPNVEGRITQALVKEFQQDGSLKVINDDTVADAVLNVTLTSYSLKPLAFNDVQNTRAEEYRILLVAKANLVRQSTGEVIAEFPRVRGDTEFIFTGDLTSSKRQNLEDAAEDLAHDIVENVVEAWE